MPPLPLWQYTNLADWMLIRLVDNYLYRIGTNFKLQKSVQKILTMLHPCCLHSSAIGSGAVIAGAAGQKDVAKWLNRVDAPARAICSSLSFRRVVAFRAILRQERQTHTRERGKLGQRHANGTLYRTPRQKERSDGASSRSLAPP